MRLTFSSWAIAVMAVLAPALALGGDSQDRAVAEQIATVLRDSGEMQNYSVGIKYKEGTVWITGRVTSNQQMQAALQVLSDIEGIDQIVNNITVASGVSPASATSKPRPGAKLAGQKAAARPAARAVTPASAEMQAAGQEQEEEGDASPASYNRTTARHAARHGHPMAMYAGAGAGGPPPAYDQPHMPNYAWPSYAASPNYAAVTYPKQYSPTAFPYIGPFYPYPQVPLGWRKVALEWDDGWWFLDFYDRNHH